VEHAGTSEQFCGTRRSDTVRHSQNLHNRDTIKFYPILSLDQQDHQNPKSLSRFSRFHVSALSIPPHKVIASPYRLDLFVKLGYNIY
jgi:hypothetical protein